MRNLLALTAALVLVFLGLGWYLGWYQIRSRAGDDGHREINIDLNTNKIKTDVGNKVRDLFKDKNPGMTPDATATPGSRVTPITPTGFRSEDGGFVYPGGPFTPVPPGGAPSLPPPQ